MAPFLLSILLGLALTIVMARVSARRTRLALDANSTDLREPRLDPVLGRLAAALDVPAIPVRVWEVPVVNGLADPDGRVFLTRGFLQKLRAGEVSPEEIGSVVAHELGHVALGHSRRRMIDATGGNAVRMGLAFALSRVLGGLGVWVAQGLMALLHAGLSRRDEFEADRYATALLIKAGIGAGPQKSLFRKLDALAGRGARPPAWLLTHPATAQRVAAIEEAERRWLAA